MALDPLTAALTIGGQVISRIWPDPADQAKAQLALLELAQRGELAQLTAQADVIKTEAASEHWLSAVWRPLLMLTFGGLIVARWFGWAAPNLAEAEYIKLWNIVELGIGGYTVGRSFEKIVPHIANAISKR